MNCRLILLQGGVVEDRRDKGDDGTLGRSANFIRKVLEFPKKYVVDRGIRLLVLNRSVEPRCPVLELPVAFCPGRVRR